MLGGRAELLAGQPGSYPWPQIKVGAKIMETNRKYDAS
jgi:hypothetical protein